MHLRKLQNATKSNNTTLLYLSLIAFVFSFSCKNSSKETDAYLNKIFDKVDSSGSSYTRADIELLDSAFANVKNADVNQRANRYMHKVYYYRATKEDDDSTLLYADSTINLLQNHINKNWLSARFYANAFFAKGNVFLKIKNYDEAIRNFTIGKIILSSKVKDPCEEYFYYQSMANILYIQKKYKLAADFFRMKYTIGEHCGYDPFLRFWGVQENMDNTGICYFKAGLTDSAAYYYNLTLQYIEQHEEKYKARAGQLLIAKSVVYANQADILNQQKNYKEAELLYLKSITATKEADEGFTRATRLSLAAMYLNLGQVKKAANVLNDISIKIDSTEISTQVSTYYKTLSDYYIKVQQPYKAHAMLLHSYNINDSIEKRDYLLNTTDVGREFENREQKAINERLKKENEIKNVYLLVTIISAVLGLVIILLILMNLKRTSAYVKKLTALNNKVNQKNDDLQRTLQSLEQSHRENNRIVKMVAHDLKNPIAAIRTLAYSLLKKEQPEQTKESLELIASACVDSINLIKDLLDNKRNLSNVGKELVDMGNLIEQCTELFQAKAEEKKRQLTLHIEHPVLMLNRQKIWRVISNLINNAIKFSPENTIINVNLKRLNESSILLSVKDNGIGIPDNIRDKIFTIDPENSRQGTAGEESYGLGLSIASKIIEEHNGKIWFESDVGKGSVFYVQLPYAN